METNHREAPILAQPATASRLRRLAVPLGWDEATLIRAQSLAGIPPSKMCWLQLADRFLLVFAILLLLGGIAAFFAHNWAEMGRFVKFASLQVGIIAMVALAWQRGLDTAAGRGALFAAAFLVGLLLAVFGQAYQTGADPYGLFLGWALLISGWALIGRQAGIWMLMTVLANLTLILYWEQVLHPPEGFATLAAAMGPLFWLTEAVSDSRLAQLVFALNALILVLWEWLARRGVSWMQGTWFPRIVALFALSAILATTLTLIFVTLETPGHRLHYAAPVWFALFACVSLWYYRERRPDLFILCACLLAVIMMVTTLVGRFSPGGIEIALLLSLLVIGQTAAAAVWLRKVAKEWSVQG